MLNIGAVPLVVHTLQTVKDFYKSRSIIKVKVRRSHTLVCYNGLVSGKTHAGFEGFGSNNAKVIAKV